MWDICIGNPPYMTQAPGESTSDKPCYNDFMDSAFEVAKKVELITPARFLFNAGATSKNWNKKMLEDEHFKVLYYEADAAKVFPKTSITGGIAITYRDSESCFQPIMAFSAFAELNAIKQKVFEKYGFESLSGIISGRTPYLFTEQLHVENPTAAERLSDGHKYDVSSNAFKSLPDIFIGEECKNGDDYYRVLGRLDGERAYFWIKKRYVRGRNDSYLDAWKVFLPRANGASGMLVEDGKARLISKPIVGEPCDIATDTFLCVGSFEDEFHAEALLKYLKCKFTRALLGVLKITQDCTSDKWKYVPIQDFGPRSDINWDCSIANLDQQLYKKYGLSDMEIQFIETHVEEMS